MTNVPTVIEGPSIEPVTLAEAKLHCKVDYDEENSLFAIFISAAREFFESAASYTVHEQTLEITVDRSWAELRYAPACDYGVMELPRATPLIEIVSIKYLDQNGAEQLWDSGNYSADVDSIPGRVLLEPSVEWPSPVWTRPRNALRIRYRAGIPTLSPLVEAPGGIKLPILMLVNGMYENRESETVTDRASIQAFSMRYGVDAFIARIRDRVTASSY